MNGSAVEIWAVLDMMAKLSDTQFKEVVQGFVSVGKENGIKFRELDKFTRVSASMRDMDEALAIIKDSLIRIRHNFVSIGKKFGLGLYDKDKALWGHEAQHRNPVLLENQLIRVAD